DPIMFLFDEPLSNLDAKLRIEMRSEIKLLHQRVGKTIVYVTHDQIEAMTLGDRIAVMKDGIVQQFGAPQDIYGSPSNLFVAGFIGAPPMNFINGKL
ncbi:sugar ABC transporter ATP-binding protein, partial [Cupriavidus sp. SIMBA_020]